MGFPLYVDGEFAGQKAAPLAPKPVDKPPASYDLRTIYQLLREHRVDVVMGGDTHAYQRYQVDYTGPDGQPHTMHHIVNGGGGAYLSPPMDSGWFDFRLAANTDLCG